LDSGIQCFANQDTVVLGWEKNPAWLGYKQKVPEWLRQTMR
jgi:hypothetical protein